MIPIPQTFTKQGFGHRLLKRLQNIAIFERWHTPKPDKIHFEVVRITDRPDRVVFGNEAPAREVYPPAEQWGTDGFTYNDRAEAEERFMEMVSGDQEKTSVHKTALS